MSAVRGAARQIAEPVGRGHPVALTHGNGPQVGNLLITNELARPVVPPVPLEWCVAQTQATIGLIVANTLKHALRELGVARHVATVVTRVRVDFEPTLMRPTKPIGHYVPAEEARKLSSLGQVWRDYGARGWRRVVPSPEPLEIIDAHAIATLVSGRAIVVASGGGGITVADGGGLMEGVEAVIDKDLSGALLARSVGADVFIIAAGVEGAVVGVGTRAERPIRRTTPAELRRLQGEGQFGEGIMHPKIEASAPFVEAGGRRAVITSLEHISEAPDGHVGTVVEADAA